MNHKQSMATSSSFWWETDAADVLAGPRCGAKVLVEAEKGGQGSSVAQEGTAPVRWPILLRNWHRLARRAAEVCVTECLSAVKYERYRLTAWAYSMHYEELHRQLWSTPEWWAASMEYARSGCSKFIVEEEDKCARSAF